ncbi:high affinity immunoglobulin epsilon receptor subunit gamma [Poecile atricapillus]|uniref:high affinity immunoglobulin epsilon receptor subunit gamma n=1 Tax=Poecile atricapillus TaxID=48891 RepID=UPI0027387F3B|nr:high affinity immunoglobulin epsilon receptor subunit gamma [Poecile atricapillus]
MGISGCRCLRGLLLLGGPGRAAAALAEPQLCYVLDAVLFLIILILTGLYLRLRLSVRAAAQKPPEVEPVYAGLSSDHPDTYETLEMKRP